MQSLPRSPVVPVSYVARLYGLILNRLDFNVKLFIKILFFNSNEQNRCDYGIDDNFFCYFLFSNQNVCRKVCATPSTIDIYKDLIFGEFENMSFFQETRQWDSNLSTLLCFFCKTTDKFLTSLLTASLCSRATVTRQPTLVWSTEPSCIFLILLPFNSGHR
jgi:hypothetical protein